MPAGRSVTEIPQPSALIEKYLSPNKGYAWPLYDEDPSPNTLSGADLCAPALLSYPIHGTYLNEMGAAGNPYSDLVERMREFCAVGGNSVFGDLDAAAVESLATRNLGDAIQGPPDWQALIRCLDAVSDCDGLTSVAVTKILHRKRPELVPLNDSRIRSFYGLSGRWTYPELFAAVHSDLQRTETSRLLAELCLNRSTPMGRRPLTYLRALDIVVWMHSE